MGRRSLAVLAAITIFLIAYVAVGDRPAAVTTLQPGEQAIAVELVTDNLDAPVFLTSPPNDTRLFVIEKLGRIRIIENGVLLEDPFLDVSDVVELGPEQGLLGLAFDPGYAASGRFFVYYTTSDLYSHVVEYRVSEDPNRADEVTAETLLSIERPTWRHNAGWIAFGPDGLLYVASGDGGGTNDPYGHGQNQGTLMGTIFRMSVDGDQEPEVVAWGLRNPWRASFDGNQIYLGDVGQDTWEEIDTFDIGTAPVNFGWSVMEGPNCYLTEECDETDLVDPLYAYTHEEGCSVTGGYVYRGNAIPELQGTYFFADWCTGFVRSIDTDSGDVSDWTSTIGNLGAINSFGVDSDGELYILIQAGRLLVTGGAVYKVVPQ